MLKKIHLENIIETQNLATSIGSQLQGGEVIELIGDVGAGKTTFTKALVAAAGSNDDVTSPTFTVRNVYNAKDITIYHYDFYRIEDYEVTKRELVETLEDDQAVLVIEWADDVRKAIPEHLQINLKLVSADEHERAAIVHLPESYRHITIPT